MSVYEPKHLDGVGRCECCQRKPLVHRRCRIKSGRTRGHFCSRCDRAYSLETGAQIENWAWRAVDGGFQSTAKRPTSNPPLMPGAPKCHYCNDILQRYGHGGVPVARRPICVCRSGPGRR
jgi:hypothetical protein